MFSSRIDKICKYILYFAILLFVLEYFASTANVQFNHVVDAVGYYYFSKVPFLSTDFWLGMRPVGYPIFIKLLGSNPNLVVAVQSFLFLFSWSFLAVYLYIRAKNKLFGLLNSIGILFIVIQPSISAWTHHILTESLTFTLLSWILIFLYELLITKERRYLYFLLFILLFYSTIRDVNAYYVITFIIVFSILLFYRHIKKYDFMIATGILLFSFAFSDYTANHSRDTISDKTLTFQSNGKTIAHRWLFPYMNLVGHRFLTNLELLEYMKKEGMPINDALLKLTNVWGGPWWYSEPELKKFRDWVAQSGKYTYTKFLITHPSYTFDQLYLNRHQIFHYKQKEQNRYYLQGYKIDNFFTYSTIENITFYRLLFYTYIIIILLSLIMRKNIFNIHTLPILALMIPIGLLSIITYHGDAMDIYRHTLIIPVLLKITMLMLVYVFGNELFLKSKYMDKT
jgi:hypothetical protein